MSITDAILTRVGQGPVPMRTLVDDVARASHVHPDEVVATVWDLVGEDRLDYRADGQVRR